MTANIEQLELRIKELELIVLNLFEFHNKQLRVSGICVNASLHTHPEFSKECPPDLDVPHYTWKPMYDFGRNFINLHPRNVPR